MAELVSRIYGGFRGVDFRGAECHLTRSPDCLNVWRDYKETESIRTRPGMERRQAFDEVVYGIFFFNGSMLVHSGEKLYKADKGICTVLFDGAATRASCGFTYAGMWYFKDGKNYLRYDGERIAPVEGYVPTTRVSGKADGGGVTNEDVNMLTGMRKNTFLADGEGTHFYLDAQNIDTDFAPVVTVEGETVGKEAYTVDYAAGCITFTEAPAAPDTDGADNITVLFRRTVDGYRETILGCTLTQVFDNRVFFSGNPAHPNVVWHCSLDDPTYVSDLDYYREGLDTAHVRGLVAGNNALWVFREPSDANTTVFYHTPTIDEEYGKVYPSTHSSVTTGCIGRAVNFGDDIVFFSERGMEGISGDVTTEQVLAHRSSLVDRRLTAEVGYSDMLLCEWEGYLLVIIGCKVYLADSRAVFTNEDHMEYEWFYWELERDVTAAVVKDGVLYLGCADGVYTLTDMSADVACCWVTPKDKFNHPHKLKTTNKRGCVAEGTGDITVYAKVEDTPFEWIGEYVGVTDAFVSRIKRKKFKDIQLKFQSATRFSLETVTLECFIGAYIKRAVSEAGAASVSLLWADGLTGKVYKPIVSGGALEIIETNGTGTDDVRLADAVTGDTYKLYVSGGNLIMDEADGTGAASVSVTDAHTGKKYGLYVEDGSFMMEEE